MGWSVATAALPPSEQLADGVICEFPLSGRLAPIGVVDN